VRRRLLLGLVPVLLAATGLAATAAPVQAADVTETGVTTYQVVPSKGVINVTIQLSIHNNKPNSGGYYYYWTDVTVGVELEATAIKSSSNAGKVTQKVVKNGTYYREIQLTFKPVYYGQTRTVTVTYTIPAAPHTKSDYRASAAYASLCASGNGTDSGSLRVIIPDGYDVAFESGETLSSVSDTGGLQTYSTGTVAQPYALWSCLSGTNTKALVTTSIKSAGQDFSLQSWPEDTAWATTVKTEVGSDISKLADMTGLDMPGGTVLIKEVGDTTLGEYVGSYNPVTKTAIVTEDTDKATIAHELSHIWFNPKLFSADWMSEGFATYAESLAGAGNFDPCLKPGAYPGSGDPDLNVWKYLDMNSTKQESDVVTYQYAASCYLVTTLATDMGPANLKKVLMAAAKDQIAYVGSSPAETSPLAAPISDKALLDLVDELGMVPAGVKDMNTAGDLMAQYGIVSKDLLTTRSTARTNYHALVTAAGTWAMPLVLRDEMASWDFASAQKAMDTSSQVLALRDQAQSAFPGLKLDGTDLEKQFEAAATQSDLDSVLALAQKEADAAAVVARARAADDGSRSIFQTVGLIGADVSTPMTQATDALTAVKPDDATAAAQTELDRLSASGDQGTIRLGVALGILLVVILLVLIVTRRRRRPAVAAAAPGFAAGQWGVQPTDPTAAAWGTIPPANGTGQWGVAPPAAPAWGTPPPFDPNSPVAPVAPAWGTPPPFDPNSPVAPVAPAWGTPPPFDPNSPVAPAAPAWGTPPPFDPNSPVAPVAPAWGTPPPVPTAPTWGSVPVVETPAQPPAAGNESGSGDNAG
jgi:hypothetical protein